MTVIDATALLAILFDEEGGETAAPLAEGAIVSAVSVAEVLTKVIEGGYDPDGVTTALGRLGLTVEPFTTDQARIAAEIAHADEGVKLSLGACATLALAVDRDAGVLTADPTWTALDIGTEITSVR